jgi:hypothetical protein
MPELSKLRFATVPAGTYELGWRFDESLPAEARKAITEVTSFAAVRSRFSKRRKAKLSSFAIATTAVAFEDLLGDPDEIDGIGSIKKVCAHIDERLAADGLRLPTEDELEAAAGGSLFPWGMQVPPGVPYGRETSFAAHKKPNAMGLKLNHDPYKVEVCRHALKLGDGGSAICGDEPWPMAWLALSPAFRLKDSDVADCLPETLAMSLIRPVRRT